MIHSFNPFFRILILFVSLPNLHFRLIDRKWPLLNSIYFLRSQIRKGQVIPSMRRKYHSSNLKMTLLDPLKNSLILIAHANCGGYPYRKSYRIFNFKIDISASKILNLEKFRIFDKNHNLSCNFDLSGHILICHPLSWQNRTSKIMWHYHLVARLKITWESEKKSFTDLNIDLNLWNLWNMIGW